MATRSLTVVAQVKDAASANLKKIASSLGDVNKSVRKSSVDFTEFNRVLFSTSAFLGLFSKAFDKVVGSLNQASELERISDQFERVMGPRGSLFSAINGMTKNSIDRMEAMKSGIALGSLGIVRDTKSMAEVIARSGTAAKRAGFQSAEGIKRVTDFLKDGSISHLQFLNVIAATNPALQAQMAILQKAGGVMGTVISTQAKLRLGMAALRAATQGMNEDQRDLMDVMADVSQSFAFVRGEFGRFIGKALTPIIEKVKDFNFAATDLIERIRKTDQTLITTVKNLFIVGSALTSVIATLGTARLFFKALGALGIGGIPFVTAALLGLAAAFTDVQKATQTFTNMAKSVGAVLLGTFQLVSSFIHDADNFKKGIGKMDSGLHDFLQKQGLLELTKNIARLSAVIITFSKDVGQTLVDWFKKAADFIDPLIKKISEFFGKSDPKGWARGWIEGGKGVRGMLVNLTAAAIAAFGAFKLISLGKGFLAKLPVIGGLFGGGGSGKKGPAGTASDPIYTKQAGAFGPIQKFTLLEKIFGKNSKLFPTFTKFAQALRTGATGMVAEGGLGSLLTRVFAPVGTIVAALMSPVATLQKGVGLVAAGGARIAGAFGAMADGLTFLMARMALVGQVIQVAFLNPMATLRMLFSAALPYLSAFVSGLGTAVGIVARFFGIFLAVMGAVGAVKGIFEGLSETGSGFIEFFKSIGNLGGALFSMVENFIKTNTVLQTIYNALKDTAKAFIELPKSIFEMIVEGWKQIAGWLGIAAQFVADKVNALATKLNMNTGKDIAAQTAAGPGFANAFGVPAAAQGLNGEARNLAAVGLKANPETGKNEVAFVPTMPEREADKSAIVQQAISQLTGFEQTRMKTAFEMANQDAVITPEEWKSIYKDAIDDSKLTKHAETQAKKPDKPTPMKTQRC